MNEKSIYILEDKYNNVVKGYVDDMKVIMIKGIGYLMVSKNLRVDEELMLSLASSMEDRNIKL